MTVIKLQEIFAFCKMDKPAPLYNGSILTKQSTEDLDMYDAINGTK